MATNWLKNLSHKAAHIKMLQPVYIASLGKLDDPLEFQTTPADLFGGDAGRGRWIANGQIDINGHRVPLDFDHWYLNTDYQNTPFFDKLHGFEFLAELKSLGGDVGRKTARNITQEWLNHFQKYNHRVWSIDLTATRMVNWMMAYNFAYDTATDEFLDIFHLSFFRQFHHLRNALINKSYIDDFEKFNILWALVITQCHCAQFYDEVDFQSYLQIIKGTVDDVSFKGGGLIDRNPQSLLCFAKSLIQLRQSLQVNAITPPLWLNKSIEVSVRTLNLMTHYDKDLPNMQGTALPNKQAIEKCTQLSNLRFRRNDTELSDYGFTTMRKGRTSIIIDHGDNGEHLSPFAFEIGYATHRLFVNCGTYFNDPEWTKSLSGTAAHNCLMVGSTEPKQGLLDVKTSLESLNGASLFSGTHRGYVSDYGVTHTRRIYLDSVGDDIRGEDVLVRNIAINPLDFMARFHLHPNVKASLIEDGVLMRLSNGTGWVFTVSHGTLGLAESMYCPDGLNLRKSQQITLSHTLDDLSHTIKWAIKRQ